MKVRKDLLPLAAFKGLVRQKGNTTNRQFRRVFADEVKAIGMPLLALEHEFIENVLSAEFEDSEYSYNDLYTSFLEAFNKNFALLIQRNKPTASTWNNRYFEKRFRPVES